MSHLIIEQGKKTGRTIRIPKRGLKIGRSPINDIVLSDKNMMLFHGRLFFEADESLWITDFGGEKRITINDQDIEESKLHIGDIITAGEMIFRVQHATYLESDEGTEEIPEPINKPATEELIDNTASKEVQAPPPSSPIITQGTTPNKSSASLKVLVAILTILVLIFGTLTTLQYLKIPITPPPKKNALKLNIEQVIGNQKNIRRYYIKLNANETCSIQVDDLKNNHHITKTFNVSATQLEQLFHEIELAGFFEVGGYLIEEQLNTYDLTDIILQKNDKIHRVQVLNRATPKAINKTKTIIERFVQTQTGLIISSDTSPKNI